MSQFSITLQDNTRTIDTLRERDSPLMAHVIHNNYVSEAKLITFNKCWMNLQVFNISDMTTGDGNYITENAWQGIIKSTECSSDFKRPRILKPTNKEWEVWKLVLCKSICVDVPQCLDTSLGLWRKNPPKWKWFLTPEYDLIEKTETSYRIHPALRGRTRSKLYCLTGEVWDSDRLEELSLRPTTIKRVQNGIVAEGSQEIKILDEQVSNESKSSDSWLYFSMQKQGEEIRLAHAIQYKTAIAVTDDSCFLEDRIGTAAWIITTPSLHHQIQGTSIAPGRGDNYNSFRSEMTGIIAILDKLTLLCK